MSSNTEAKALAGALKENSSLKELYLHYTSIGSDGFKQLLEGCAKNSTLKKLECGKCGIDEKALDAIDAFCRARSSEKTLQHIGLFGNAECPDFFPLPRACDGCDDGRATRAMARQNSRFCDHSKLHFWILRVSTSS